MLNPQTGFVERDLCCVEGGKTVPNAEEPVSAAPLVRLCQRDVPSLDALHAILIRQAKSLPLPGRFASVTRLNMRLPDAPERPVPSRDMDGTGLIAYIRLN